MYIFLDNWCSFHILFIYIALSNTQMEYLLILSGINFYRLLFYSEKKCSFYILVSYSGNKIIFYTDFNWSALWFFVLCYLCTKFGSTTCPLTDETFKGWMLVKIIAILPKVYRTAIIMVNPTCRLQRKATYGLVNPYMGNTLNWTCIITEIYASTWIFIQFLSLFERIYLVWLSSFILWSYLIDNYLPIT